ncbi:MAG: hypothetical protein NC923_07325 [Candidatus Omnitrophica bacterium]|nr:hypothetical protein [Candidatus Omnitrophota bacterium]
MLDLLMEQCLKITLYGIYTIVLILSIIFTVSLEFYSKIEVKIESTIFRSPTYSLLDENITILDDLMKDNHVLVGSIMVILCIFDFVACQYITANFIGSSFL